MAAAAHQLHQLFGKGVDAAPCNPARWHGAGAFCQRAWGEQEAGDGSVQTRL